MVVVTKFTRTNNVHTAVMTKAASDGKKGLGSPFQLGQGQGDRGSLADGQA